MYCHDTGDVGGYMGLLLGASIMSLVEIIDYIFLAIMHKMRGRSKEKSEDPRMDTLTDCDKTNVQTSQQEKPTDC